MKQQLEITFDASTQCRPRFRSQQRRSKAQWWFTHMRNIVDTAFDWKTPRPARPEQIYFRLERDRCQ
jgi:hypothetical protein